MSELSMLLLLPLGWENIPRAMKVSNARNDEYVRARKQTLRIAELSDTLSLTLCDSVSTYGVITLKSCLRSEGKLPKKNEDDEAESLIVLTLTKLLGNLLRDTVTPRNTGRHGTNK